MFLNLVGKDNNNRLPLNLSNDDRSTIFDKKITGKIQDEIVGNCVIMYASSTKFSP